MTQSHNPVAYQAGAEIAADRKKKGSLVWSKAGQARLEAEFRPFMELYFSCSCFVVCISAEMIGQARQPSLAIPRTMNVYGRTPASRKSWTCDGRLIRVIWRRCQWAPGKGGVWSRRAMKMLRTDDRQIYGLPHIHSEVGWK